MTTDHPGRRIIHTFSSAVPLSYVLGILSWTELRVLTFLGVLLAALLELDRLYFGNSYLDPLYRDYERGGIAGYAYAIFSIFLAVNLFRPEVAVVSILMLSFADPIVGIMGGNELRRVKRPHLLAGMFAISFGVVVGSTYLFDAVDLSVAEAVAGGLGATVADGIFVRIRGSIIDDNLTIPLYAGGLITLVGWVATMVV
ncbi:MAG: dolichol kinase [Halobacteria archaeon]|nr:dolichol kinase [Halobacteria archaeon]